MKKEKKAGEKKIKKKFREATPPPTEKFSMD